MKFRFVSALVLALCVVLSAGAAAQTGNRGSVANATFTSKVVDGSPVDFREQFTNTAPAVYFYGELLDMSGQTVQHRWSLEGKVMQVVPIAVTRARQPAWSQMAMKPDWTGNWTVEVVNAKGEVVGMKNFAYNPPL